MASLLSATCEEPWRSCAGSRLWGLGRARTDHTTTHRYTTALFDGSKSTTANNNSNNNYNNNYNYYCYYCYYNSICGWAALTSSALCYRTKDRPSSVSRPAGACRDKHLPGPSPAYRLDNRNTRRLERTIHPASPVADEPWLPVSPLSPTKDTRKIL